MRPLRLAFLTTDKREHGRDYDNPRPGFGTAPEALLAGFSDLPELQVEIVSCAQKRMPSPVSLAGNIRHHSIYVPKAGWLRTFYAGCIRATTQKLGELQPDIIHAQGTERDCAISSIFSRRPKVLTIHGNCRAIAQVRGAPLFSYWWLQARLEKFCIPRFEGVVCISKYTQNLVSALARKTWLLPNAVDPAFFDLSRSQNGGRPSILVVASVEHRKNQVGLIHSLGALVKQVPFQLKFFGSCGQDAYGREFLGLVGRHPWVAFGGMIDRATLRKEFSCATALILPTWEDNCPMVVLEAQAAGLPVIASNVGGVPDLVQDGVTGLLTDPSRPETMADALGLLLRNPDLREKLSRAGRIQALARFHPRVIAQRHLEIYREVIAAT